MHWVRIESPAYWAIFIGVFLAVAIWESSRPLRSLGVPARRRWGNHALLFAASAIFTGAILRATPVFVAIAFRRSHFGLLNRGFVPVWAQYAITILALDLVRYAIHRLYHSVHLLWRIHEVHHSDPDFDVSTATRFHPIETFIEQAIYLGAVVLLVPPPGAVLTEELITIASNLFVHANKSLPPAIERALSMVVFTPDLHRIHHSEEWREQNRNFGQFFPWWDRLFGTYAGVPERGGKDLVTGLKELRGVDTMAFAYMLAEPFHRPRSVVTTSSSSPAPKPTQR